MSSASSEKQQVTSNKQQAVHDSGGPIRIVLNAFVIFVLSQFIALLVVELLQKALRPGSHAGIDYSAAAQFFYILLAEGLAAAAVFRIVRRRSLRLDFIGYGRWPTWRDAGWAVAGFVGFYGLLFAITAILLLFIPSFNTNAPQDVGFNFLSTTPDRIIAFAALVLLPPLGEETLMRGYLFSGLRARMKFWPALLFTSLLFGAAHLSSGVSGALWAAGVDTFILSAVLVFLRERTGALYAPIIVHSLNNLVAFFAHFHG